MSSVGRRSAEPGRTAGAPRALLMSLVLTGLLACAAAAHAEIYQWVDEKGGVHFSDQPPPAPPRKPEFPAAPARPPASQPPKSAVPSAPKPKPADVRAVPPAHAYPALATTAASPTLQIRAMLREGKFGELNALLAQRQEEARTDVRREADLFAAYGAFAVNDRSYEERLNRWVAAFPQSYQPYLARAGFYAHMGWEARGTKWASETSDDQFKAMRDCFTKSGRDLQEVLQRQPRCVVAYALLLEMMDKTDETGAGRKALAKALEVAPASFQVRSVYLHGITPRWGGSYEEMRKIAEEAKKYLPQNPRLAVLEGFADYDAGDMEDIRQNHGHAEALLTKALSFGDHGFFFKRRASVRHSLGKDQEALQDINRAIELWPHDGRYYLERSKILVSLKRLDEALRDIELADLLRPNDDRIARQKQRVASSLEQRGYELQKQNDPQAAVAVYTEAIRATPESATVHVRRARALVEANKLDEALGDLERAIDLDPNEFNTYLLLDWVLTRKQAWDRVIAGWDRYLALHPENGRAYVERGGAYYRKGDIKSAVADAKRAADLGNADGRQLYERFKGMMK